MLVKKHLEQLNDGFDQRGVENLNNMVQRVTLQVCSSLLKLRDGNLLAKTTRLGAKEKNVVGNTDVHPRCCRDQHTF